MNPGEESWSDRVEYYLKILTGKEIAPADKVTITVDSAAFGKPADKTADATVLSVNPAQPYNSIQLLKAILLAQDEIEPRLSSINSVLNAKLNALDANTNDVERLIFSVATEITSMKAAINNNLIDTKTVTQAILSKLNDPIPVVTNSNYFNSGSNSAVVITLGTAAGKKRLIDQITVSYAGGIGKGLLSVSEGTISYFKTAISLEGTQIVSFAKPISSTLDGTLTITLDPGGVGITGYLNVIVLEGEVGVSQGLSGQSARLIEPVWWVSLSISSPMVIAIWHRQIQPWSATFADWRYRTRNPLLLLNISAMESLIGLIGQRLSVLLRCQLGVSTI